MSTLKVHGRELALPAFLPDATYGYVRSLTSADCAKWVLQP